MRKFTKEMASAVKETQKYLSGRISRYKNDNDMTSFEFLVFCTVGYSVGDNMDDGDYNETLSLIKACNQHVYDKYFLEKQ